MRVLVVLAVLAAAGCSLRGSEQSDPQAPKPFHLPSWLNATYSDGKTTIRYPADWTRVRSDRFGEYLDDATKRTAAFVGVRYLPRREYASHAQFAEVAAAIQRLRAARAPRSPTRRRPGSAAAPGSKRPSSGRRAIATPAGR
jgi:hypothetical protein